MREIKFRGKSADEWVYGDLWQYNGLTWIVAVIDGEGRRFPVDPATVGQYITTVGDVDLYDQDIVETRHRIYDDGEPRLNLLVFEELCWKVKAINDEKAASIPLALYLNDPASISLVGNRWDQEGRTTL